MSTIATSHAITPPTARIKNKKPPGSKLAPLDSRHTESVGGSSANVKPRKTFLKKDLVEAVRRMGEMSVSSSTGLLGMGTGGKGRKSKQRKPAKREDEVSSQLRVMESGVTATSRKYNELKISADRKAVELQQLLDTLAMLKVEDDALTSMKKGTTYESIRIGQLTAELEEATKETDALLQYRRTMEHMLRRLQTNQVRFDSHLNGMETASETAQKELTQVESLTRSLEVGRTKALQDWQATKYDADMQYSRRQKELEAKEMEADMARKMDGWRIQREEMRIQMAQQLRGDLTEEEEQELLARERSQRERVSKLRVENEERQKQVAAMEALFAKVRQATGASELEDMLAKISNQSTNQAALEHEKFEAERQLSTVKIRYEDLEKGFSEMKARGIGHTELNREVSDKLNAAIAEASGEANMAKAACERLETILIGVRQGGLGLCQRLLPFYDLLDDEEDKQPFREERAFSTDAASIPPANNTAEALRMAETILSKMLEASSGGGPRDSSHYTANASDEDEDEDAIDQTPEDDTKGPILDEMPDMANNIRVLSKKQLQACEDKAPDDMESVHDEEREGVSDLESDDGEGVEDIVPSRAFLKLCSTRQHAEVSRKREQDERKKQLAMKMEAADENEKATLMSKIARKKYQDAAMEKISGPLPSSTLPPGVTPKDDIYTKTEAFLTQVPELD